MSGQYEERRKVTWSKKGRGGGRRKAGKSDFSSNSKWKYLVEIWEGWEIVVKGGWLED